MRVLKSKLDSIVQYDVYKVFLSLLFYITDRRPFSLFRFLGYIHFLTRTKGSKRSTSEQDTRDGKYEKMTHVNRVTTCEECTVRAASVVATQ